MNAQTKHIKLLAIFAFILLLAFSAIQVNAQNESDTVIFGNPDGSVLHWQFADTATIPIWISHISAFGGGQMQIYLNLDIVSQFIDLDSYFSWIYGYTYRSPRLTILLSRGSCPDSLNHVADINVMATDDSSHIGQTFDSILFATVIFYDTTGYYIYPATVIIGQVHIDPPADIHEPGIIPSKPFLYGNYPNPFNSSTAIRFYLPKEADAEITIYNIAGQFFREYDLADLSAGEKQVIWDGKDSHGQQISSGIYFYSIKTNGFFQTSRMTLLK